MHESTYEGTENKTEASVCAEIPEMNHYQGPSGHCNISMISEKLHGALLDAYHQTSIEPERTSPLGSRSFVPFGAFGIHVRVAFFGVRLEVERFTSEAKTGGTNVEPNKLP